jgi:hypothetical protein
MYNQAPLPFVGHHYPLCQVASSKTEDQLELANLLVLHYIPCNQGIRQPPTLEKPIEVDTRYCYVILYYILNKEDIITLFVFSLWPHLT